MAAFVSEVAAAAAEAAAAVAEAAAFVSDVAAAAAAAPTAPNSNDGANTIILLVPVPGATSRVKSVFVNVYSSGRKILRTAEFTR